MRRYVVLGLAIACLVYSLGALADSLTKPATPPSASSQVGALETLEVKSVNSGRITVSSRDNKHVFECDVLTIDLMKDGASEIRARGTVVMQMGEKKGTAEAIRLEVDDDGGWHVTSDALKVGP